MSEGQTLAQAAPPRIWHMYRSMVGVGLVCGLLIVSVFELTRPVIERNKAEALSRAIFRVLSDARSSTAFRLGDTGHFERLEGGTGVGPAVYGGYDAQHRLVGIAVQAEGMGYQDVIRVLYGYSVGKDAITGLQVLESRETPGLGDRIETDAAFLANFERLDVSLNDDQSALVHPIQFVKQGGKEHPWQVDGITGATISSTAVAEIIGGSASYWVPRIRQNLDDFQSTE